MALRFLRILLPFLHSSQVFDIIDSLFFAHWQPCFPGSEFSYHFCLGGLGQQYSCMGISRNQLRYDEHEREALKVSLGEMLLLSDPELFHVFQKRDKEKEKKMFIQLSSDPDNMISYESASML